MTDNKPTTPSAVNVAIQKLYRVLTPNTLLPDHGLDPAAIKTQCFEMLEILHQHHIPSHSPLFETDKDSYHAAQSSLLSTLILKTDGLNLVDRAELLESFLSHPLHTEPPHLHSHHDFIYVVRALSTQPATQTIPFFKVFLERGFDPDESDPQFNSSALLSSTHRGSAELCRLFLDYGANPLRQDSYWRYPLSEFATRAEPDFLHLLKEHRSLLDPELLNCDGHNALHLAAINGQLENITYLISMGFDPLQLDYKKKTPSDMAKTFDQHDAYRLLKEAELAMYEHKELQSIVKEAQETLPRTGQPQEKPSSLTEPKPLRI